MTFSEHYIAAILSLTACPVLRSALRDYKYHYSLALGWEAGPLGRYSTYLVTKQMYRLRYIVILH